MFSKALFHTAIFLLLLLALSWMPRLLFHGLVSEEVGLAGVMHWNYLKTSVLFDVKTMAYWFGPLFLLLLLRIWVKGSGLQRAIGIVAFLLSMAYLLFCFAAYLYYPILKTIVGKELFTLLRGQEWSIVWSYVWDYWWAALIVLVLAQLFSRQLTRIRFPLRSWGLAGYLLLMIACWGLAARGSFSLKPLNHLDAYAQLPAEEAISAMSPAFVLLESFSQDGLEDVHYVSEELMREERARDMISIRGSGSWRPNICILMLESFGMEYTAQGGVKSYTPFLDSLLQQSLHFHESYSNGLRSMDAVASIYLGVPALMKEPYVGSLYAHNQVSSLFDHLRPMGYYSSFFHGADRSSMGFAPFLRSHGLDRYYGAQDHPNPADHDGHWGIYDEAFMQFFGRELGSQREPWISSLFSLSSHHPYAVPEEFDHLPYGSLDIHHAVAYTDASLRKFFAYARKQPWFDRTVFVLTADHSSINETPRFRTTSGRFAVPLFFYHSAWEPELLKGPAQHIDLIPTLLHMLGYQGELMSLGQDLLGTDRRPLVHYASSIYMISDSSHALAFDGQRVQGLYDRSKDPLYRNDLVSAQPELAEQLAQRLKARIQNFNERLIHNRYN